MRKVTVTIHNNEYEYEAGITYEQIVKDFQKDYEAKIVLVSANGRLRELHKILSNDCTLEFITLAEKIGMETYRRSATFLLVKAVHDVIGDDSKNHLVAQYTVGRGLLCKLLDVEPTEQFIRSVHHMNLAHGLIVQEYRKTGLKAPIGVTHNLEYPRPATRSAKDRLACEHHTALRSGLFIEPMFRRTYPAYCTKELEWEFPIENGDMELISQPIDYLGINYYSEHVLRWSDTAPFGIEMAPRWEERTSGIGWQITPHGLLRLLKWAQDYAGGKLPIYITENGAACDDVLEKDPVTGEERVHDSQRIRYLSEHLQMCAEAIRQGVNLKGYFCWSFIDNYEWSHGYSKRFGIVYCDYETQRRIPKDSAYFLRDVMAGYGD